MNNPTIYYQNCRGLRSKTTPFLRNVLMNNYDIILLTETWLISGISDSELFDNRYLVFRRDRDYILTDQSKGGGVLIAVQRHLSSSINLNWQSSAEDIWVTVSLCNSRRNVVVKLHLCVLYLCEQNKGNSFSDQLKNFLISLMSVIQRNKLDKFLVVGDFNMSDILWLPSDIGLQPSISVINTHFYDFLDTLYDCNLHQFNSHKNSHDGILDLVLCNDFVSVSVCPDPLTKEDLYHKTLVIQPSFVELDPLKIERRTTFTYQRGDYNKICEYLSKTDWSLILNDGSVEDAIKVFYDIINQLRDQFVPKRQVKERRYPLWYNTALIKIIKEKYKFFKKFKNYGNKSDEVTFYLLRDRARKVEDICFRNYTSMMESAITNNPKLFWSYVKGMRGGSSYPATMKYLNQTDNTGAGISELFSAYFRSTFLEVDLNSSSFSVPLVHDVSTAPCDLSGIEVTTTQVFTLLKGLDRNKSAGPDTLPALLLINCAQELSIPVAILFRRSLNEGIMPNIWKSAFITPIHKKGSKTDVENYRPISKLCLLAKVLERVVFNQLYESIKSSFIPQQHGFLRGRSTVSNLVNFNEFITYNMERGNQVDTIYTDYCKAFDRIDHKILLSKLLSLGIRGDLFRWFTSYVLCRSQSVVLNGYSSSWVYIPSGVPQGSLLGPLLFVIFINDIGSCLLNSKFLLFADDMKIFKVVNNTSDAILLQEDLDRLDAYCLANKLELNVSKCFYINFTRKRNIFNFKYRIKNSILSRKNSALDLGVLHDSKLSFDQHISHVYDKAYKALGFIFRISDSFKRMKTLKILYCAYVRSHLEYASQIWNPCYDTYSNIIEKIQIKFSRFLGFKFKLPQLNYVSRCARLHLLPLYQRRKIADACFLLSVAQGRIDCPELLSNIVLNIPVRQFRKHKLLYVPFSRVNYRINSYLPRSLALFNKLNDDSRIDLFCSSVRNLKTVMSTDFVSSN